MGYSTIENCVKGVCLRQIGPPEFYMELKFGEDEKIFKLGKTAVRKFTTQVINCDSKLKSGFKRKSNRKRIVAKIIEKL